MLFRSTDSPHQDTDAENDPPSFLASFKYFVFGSWFNILLVFIPLSFVSHHLNWDAALRFSFSFLSIIPLAKVKFSFEVPLLFHLIEEWILASRRRNRSAIAQIEPDRGWSSERVLRKCRRNYCWHRCVVARYVELNFIDYITET